MSSLLFIIALIIGSLSLTNAFMLKTNKFATKTNYYYQRASSLNMLSFSETAGLLFDPNAGISRALGVVPMCLEPFMMPATKTTVINDPTAGMTPDEITNYLSNVGGGLCGYPDSVRTLIGLSLNLSLLALGVLALSYAIVGTISFVLDKRVDDILKKEAVNYPELSGALSSTTSLQRAQFQSESESVDDDDNDTSPDPRIPTPKDGLNRQERRFRKNFLESEKKDSE